MVKLLLAHFANPHARTSNNLTPRDLSRDCPEAAELLLDAEDSFLDLDQQKTPVKTKRFSASLLDETTEDGEEATLNVRTRTM